MIKRRNFCQAMLMFSLGSAFQKELLSAESSSFEIKNWIKSLSDLGQRLAQGEISPRQWQDGMSSQYEHVDIAALLNQVNFASLSRQFRFKDGRGEQFIVAPLPGGQSKVITKVAAVKKGRSIVPHGHANMVSAFLTLSGEFHVRMYDRLSYDDDALYIRPTCDEVHRRGQWSSISDERNNVHWLTAKTDDTYLFSTKLVQLNPQATFSAGRVPVDPLGVAGNNGVIKAKRISNDEAQERFG